MLTHTHTHTHIKKRTHTHTHKDTHTHTLAHTCRASNSHSYLLVKMFLVQSEPTNGVLYFGVVVVVVVVNVHVKQLFCKPFL